MNVHSRPSSAALRRRQRLPGGIPAAPPGRRRPARTGWLVLAVGGVVAVAATAFGVPVLDGFAGGPDRQHVDVLFGHDARVLGSVQTNDAQVELGRWLFEHTPVAAGAGHASCAECHPRDRLGTDGRTHERNTPALVDVSRQLVLGWDGGERDLVEVVRRELISRCGIVDDVAVRDLLEADDELRALYQRAFPRQPASLGRLAVALSGELSTWTTRGRWDRYVEGDDHALTALERRGLEQFVAVGCGACHRGRNLGGASAHVLGLRHEYDTDDDGRMAVTGRREDHRVFKAPMLRHAARTGPYLHDGSVHELAEVVRRMAHHELDRQLRDDQVQAIVAFLQATSESR